MPISLCNWEHVVVNITHQLGPRYEGQLMSDGGAYSPFRSILLVLTHDFIITCVYGPTGSDGHEWVIPKQTLVAHHFCCRLWRWGWCKSWAPYDHLIQPPTRTTAGQAGAPPTDLCPDRRKGTRKVQTRSGILACLCTRKHWLWITVELHIIVARHGEAVAREGGRYAPVRRVSGSEPLNLRTHRHRRRSRPLRSAVVEYQAPSVAV